VRVYDRRMTRRIFYRLLLAFALAFSGSAAQLHSLAHAQADLASAGLGHKAPSPLKHSTEQCLVVHALDGTPAETGAFLVAEDSSYHVVPAKDVRAGESPAAAFQSRAPPLAN
jgi:hypothetical protein